MYTILKRVIDRGEYNLTSIMSKADKLWAEGKITDEQRYELITSARASAKAEHSIDVMAKLIDLESRIRTLEEGKADEGTTEGIPEAEEYTIGKWYYRGDRVTFNGNTYICIAPEGAVCTWSPSEYPAYWEAE